MMDKEEGKTWKEGSNIGGFSLPDSSFKGTRCSRARGLFEHGLLLLRRRGMKRTNERGENRHAEFRRAEKDDEGMASKIRLERAPSISFQGMSIQTKWKRTIKAK